MIETFIGPISESEVVHHKDGNPANNRLDNLEAIDSGVNVSNAIPMKLLYQRDVKLNSIAARVIKWLTLNRPDITHRQIADAYRISVSHISSIKCGRSWADITLKKERRFA